MIRSIAVALLLCGCAAHSVTGPVAVLSIAPTSCPQGVPEPAPPRKPRTIEAVGTWALKLDAALRETEHARTVCAERLHETRMP